ncbi:hypothetical protein HNR46_001473 [Haloferula luteola]|uniref:EF-hand domain-containing protein n=1 Tax=Haloferula luteola TaxID=595692 RepID=A0A840VBQ6_9BACT|nr:thrombospondin type 3 repeat-containing protein [Haloferula luteola]MBB5351239.1 hypothetical protein [Haloferula luteola]
MMTRWFAQVGWLVAGCLASVVQAASAPLPFFEWRSMLATDGSVQTSLVFRSTPGVLYRFEVSQDLQTWTTFGTPIYGLGHEHALALLETSPAPSTPPNPSWAEGWAATPVSLQLQSGESGGWVATWRWLEDERLLSRSGEGDLDPAWQSVPLFSRSGQGFAFYLFHPGGTASAPSVEMEPLSGADEEFWEALADAMPSMNEEVALVPVESALAPPPAPPDPEARRFVRMRLDPELDSDGDGVFDADEFAMAADPQHPDSDLADPFSADRDGNGEPDGWSLDTDGDGIPDIEDSNRHDPQIHWRSTSAPRFAIFQLPPALDPAGNQDTPLQLTHGGAVLYQRGTWFAGAYHPLHLGVPSAGHLDQARPLAMNEKGQILGHGTVTYGEPAEVYVDEKCWWPTPQSPPQRFGDQGVMWTTQDDWSSQFTARMGRLSDAGQFFGDYAVMTALPDGGYEESHQGNALWTLPEKGSFPTAMLGKTTPTLILDDSHYWTYEAPDGGKTTWYQPGGQKVFAKRLARAFVRNPGGTYTGLFYPDHCMIQSTADASSDWKGSQELARCTGFSEQGWALVPQGEVLDGPAGLQYRRDRLWANGQTLSLLDAAPGMDGEWRVSTMNSKGGLLMNRQDPVSGDTHGAVGIPVEIEDDAFATGVDAISVTAKEPDAACEGRVWVMVPAEATEAPKFRIRTTASLLAPLTLINQGPWTWGAQGTEVPLTQTETEISVASAATTSGDYHARLRAGTQDSLSQPLGIKVMKKRTLKVNVWRIRSQIGNAVVAPPELTKFKVDTMLNRVFLNQVNLDFQSSVFDVTLSFDNVGSLGSMPDDGNIGSLDISQDFGIEAFDIRSKIGLGLEDSDAVVNVFVVGGVLSIRVPGAGYDFVSYAKADIARRHCWIIGLQVSEGEIMRSMCHEIGHILIGPGHPDVASNRGPAPLLGTDQSRRLMCSGKLRQVDGTGVLLVKKEWDLIDISLNEILELEGVE